MTPEQTGVQSDYLYKVKVRIQVHVRSNHNVDSALVNPPRVKNPGEVLNVYEEYPLVNGKLSYDSDGYCWRRIGDNMWVADDSLSGDWLIDTKEVPSTTSRAVGELAVKTGVEMNIRTSPGISNNLTGRRVIGTGARWPFYQVSKNVDGCDWYKISDDPNNPE